MNSDIFYHFLYNYFIVGHTFTDEAKTELEKCLSDYMNINNKYYEFSEEYIVNICNYLEDNMVNKDFFNLCFNTRRYLQSLEFMLNHLVKHFE